MKIIYFIVFISFNFTALAEKQFDIAPITLPYSSLILEDICAYNSTILVRGGNKIYKSSDDGESWKISFDSEKKLRQLYSLDAHTIFIVGDSGMTYRTFDYGETWEDISFVTTENFTGIAAKNYEDYLMISEKEYIFHKKNQDDKTFSIQTNSKVPLYFVIYSNNKYYFGGGVKKGYHISQGIKNIENLMPYYTYDENNVSEHKAMHLQSEEEYYHERNIDSLKLFPTEGFIYFTALENGNAIVLPGISGSDVYDPWERGIRIEKDKTVFIDKIDTVINVFNREGKWITFSDTERGFKHYTKYEHQNIGITPINSVVRTSNNSFVISSNNSTIYKVKMNEVISSVESDTFSHIKLLGNILLLGRGLELLSIYNYMGATVDYEIVSDNTYKLSKGLNFVTLRQKGTTFMIKVSVIE